MDQDKNAKPSEEAGTEGFRCDECDQQFKTVQGLAGHRRLAHSTSSRDLLDARSAELERREANAQKRERELAKRQRELDETGPVALGMIQCGECGSWLESEDNLRRHRETIHPIENAVAGEVGVSPERVTAVWVEGCRKQERHPGETPEQIVQRFWGLTDRQVLERLLARKAAFHFSEEKG